MTSAAPLLLVEDNPDDETLILRALKRANLANEIIVARDGAEAINILFEAPEPLTPALALLDLKVPKVNGLELLARIRAEPRTQRLPVVILTSSDETVDIARSYELGANSFVRKPVEFSEFTDAVNRLGVYWLLINRGLPGA